MKDIAVSWNEYDRAAFAAEQQRQEEARRNAQLEQQRRQHEEEQRRFSLQQEERRRQQHAQQQEEARWRNSQQEHLFSPAKTAENNRSTTQQQYSPRTQSESEGLLYVLIFVVGLGYAGGNYLGGHETGIIGIALAIGLCLLLEPLRRIIFFLFAVAVIGYGVFSILKSSA